MIIWQHKGGRGGKTSKPNAPKGRHKFKRRKFIVLQSRLSFFLRSGSSQLVFLKNPSTRNSCMTSWWGKALPRARSVALPGFAIFRKPFCASSPVPIFSFPFLANWDNEFAGRGGCIGTPLLSWKEHWWIAPIYTVALPCLNYQNKLKGSYGILIPVRENVKGATIIKDME